MREVFLLENGIDSAPSDWRTWPNRAMPWLFENTDFFAQSMMYFTTPLTVFWREMHREKTFSDLVNRYKKSNWKIHVAGHSNGTCVILGGLKLADWPRIETLHLICGACDSSFERNGLNQALRNGRIGKVFVYVAGRDGAMEIENILGKALFRIPFKGKPLGLNGPSDVDPMNLGRIRTIKTAPWDLYGHGSCWQNWNFDRTMVQITKNAKSFTAGN